MLDTFARYLNNLILRTFFFMPDIVAAISNCPDQLPLTRMLDTFARYLNNLILRSFAVCLILRTLPFASS